MPDGAPWASRPSVDDAIVKAVVRAFRWQRMLDDGVCGTIKELAERERVNAGYMSRVLRLTLLAPDIVEAILDGRQPEGLRLEDMLNEFPAAWVEQRDLLSRVAAGRIVPSAGASGPGWLGDGGNADGRHSRVRADRHGEGA